VAEAVLIPSGGGEIVGDAADRRIEILSDDDSLHSTWSRYGPHREGADLHVHYEHTDLFYVLEGTLTVRLGTDDEQVPVGPGNLVRVPPLVVHGFRNASDGELRYLNFHAPGRGFADFMRGLRDGRDVSYDQFPPPADGGRPTTEAAIGFRELVAEDNGIRVELLADVETIGFAEVRADPGAAAPAPHAHREHVESFYVLEGELTITAGGREVSAGAGSWVQIPRGVPHAVSPSGAAGARFLGVHTPSYGLGERDEFPTGARS
jgi:mannose-6-phosphate isomerase-like protein (cupin superfamily)